MANYEIADESDLDDADDGLDADTKQARAQEHSKKKSDAELFDELPNGIKFKDEPPEDADDADEDEDEDLERDDEDEEPEDDEPVQRRGEPKDKFQKRLMRERRLRQEAEDDARSSNENYRRLEGDIKELKSLLVTNNTTAELDKKIEGLTSKLIDVRAALKAAVEAGETDKQLELTEKLSDIKADIRNTETAKEAAIKGAEAAAKVEETKRNATPENRHLQRWLRQHGELFRSDPVFKAAAEAADKQLAIKGSVPNSEEHFKALNKILAKRFPEEFPNERGKDGKNIRRAPIGGGDEDSAPPAKGRQRYNGDIQVKGGKASLSKQHEKIMRDFGMDPDDPKDRATFVRENAPRKKR